MIMDHSGLPRSDAEGDEVNDVGPYGTASQMGQAKYRARDEVSNNNNSGLLQSINALQRVVA